MQAYLAYSYSVNLTENKALLINKVVEENKRKIYRLVFVCSLGVTFLFSNVQESEAIGLSTPSRTMVRMDDNHRFPLRTKIKSKTAMEITRQINYVAYISNQKILLIYLTNSKISSKILKLRGGALDWQVALFCFVVFLALKLAPVENVDAFVQQGWGLQGPPNFFQPSSPPPFTYNSGSSGKGSILHLYRPESIPQAEYSAMPRGMKRHLPDPRDMKIQSPNHPELELDLGFGQAEHKVVKHGAIHGLEYTQNPKTGATKTKKTEENTLKMMRSIVDMSKRENVEWILDGTYQVDLKSGFEAIHIYDPSTQIIVVFEKSTNKFVTTCQLTDLEVDDLKTTRNFGGREGWYSSENGAKNLPLRNFQTDVMGITPSDQMDGFSPIDQSPNLGFTPINTFDSDVRGITPRDNP